MEYLDIRIFVNRIPIGNLIIPNFTFTIGGIEMFEKLAFDEKAKRHIAPVARSVA